MSTLRYIIGIALLLTGVLPANSQVSNDNEDEVNKIDTRWAQDDYVPGQVLMKFKDTNRVAVKRVRGRFASTSVDKVTQVLQKYGTEEMEQLLPNENPNRQLRRAKAYNGDVIQEHDLSQLYCVTLSAEHQQEVTQVVDELKMLDEVEFAEPNYRVYAMADTHIADDYSGNPMEGQQWYLDAYGVKELWNKPIINKERPIIAILDTGVDLTHPDLKDNIWTNTIEEYGVQNKDNDGNGFNNDVHGWDFVNNSPNIRDNNMHGTHVAGIVAAANNGIGIVGANPQALIMPITVLQSDGAGDIAKIIKGIDYAIVNGATVINMSLGTYVNSLALRQELENGYGKAVLVAAAGNDGKCIYASHWGVKHDDPEPKSMPCFPAAYSFVLGVQATEKGGGVAAFSNYDDDGNIYSCESSFFDPDGFNYELKAPGKKMLSTIPGGIYKELNGTSMAAPLVAGAISALKMVKKYDTQEILWGDLLHSKNIAEAYNLTERPAELDLMKILLRERKDLTNMNEDDYGGDNEVDAGETVSIYPVIRTTFGVANNIKLKLMVDEFEDPDVVEIISDEVDFGTRLDAYGKAVSKNPLVLKISDNIVDARHVSLKVVATCDESTRSFEIPFTLVAHNMIKLNGLLTEDKTLSSNHVYYINGNLGINKGVTLTIEPGTRLEFAGGTRLKSFGKLIAKGTPQKPIYFTRHIGDDYWNGIYTHESEGGHIHKGVYTNSDMTLFTLLPTEKTPINIGNSIVCTINVKTNDLPSVSYKRFNLYDYIDKTEWYTYRPDMSGKNEELTDTTYLTPAILRMLNDYNDFCCLYSQESISGDTRSLQVSAVFFDAGWIIYDNPGDTLSFCRLEDCNFSGDPNSPFMLNCVLSNCDGVVGERNLIINSQRYYSKQMKHCNIVNNELSHAYYINYRDIRNNNYFNNFSKEGGKIYSLGTESSTPKVDHSAFPGYLGTSREDLVRPYIYELGNAQDTWGTIDLSNMPSEPYHEAHGIVWKVLVNGKDAQDEFEDLSPLGVGKHKFEVYFNRPMNKAVAPQISFGVREPFTQQSVAEDGSWNNEGTIYTAYKTITGKTMSDGINRIYVTGAEDNEYFPCPYENIRFNVIVQAAGSMATGFMAEEGLGCVKLKWDQPSNIQEDAMGINVFRYQQRTVPGSWSGGTYTPTYTVNDTIQLNQELLDLETTSLTDYDVIPGETYYYFYKMLNTDLQAMDMSNTVSATPLTSTRGDANASGNVDVADVITTVNYITKQNPQPFIFEAADMNTDNIIDILDVMGIVKGILNPSLLASASAEQTATYIIEDGTLYVNSPVALAGIQVQISNSQLSILNSQFEVASDLNGFECTSAWLSDNDYLFLAYSLNGKMLSPGKHALLHIGDALIASMRLSDANGHNVEVIGDDATKVNRIVEAMTVKGIYDLQGRKLTGDSEQEGRLPKGIYIINGRKVVK